VCGAGMAGLASALFLGRKGWDVTVLERAPQLRTGGYMIDFTASGYDAAEAAGLLPALEEIDHPVQGVVHVNEHDHVRSVLEYRQFAASLKGRILSLLRGDLEQVLYENLPETVQLRFDTSIEKVDGVGRSADVVFTDGTQMSADLLVGADGLHSWVRGLVFGAESRFLRLLG
jgi:2-polyprenyl-6-methoxyphenol hydroxylase-like FAD-dependent oxidoreductase